MNHFFQDLDEQLRGCASSLHVVVSLNADQTLTLTVVPEVAQGASHTAMGNFSLTGAAKDLDEVFATQFTAFSGKVKSVAEQSALSVSTVKSPADEEQAAATPKFGKPRASVGAAVAAAEAMDAQDLFSDGAGR